MTVLVVNIASVGSPDGHQASVEGLAPVADVVLLHGVRVLAGSSLESGEIQVADSAYIGLKTHPGCTVQQVGIRLVGGQKL